MIWYRTSFLMCFVVAISTAFDATAEAESGRVALVIGNSTYSTMPALQPCESSANVVSAALKRAGFEVTERVNSSNGEMGAAITGFADAIAHAPDRVAVAYVCGYAAAFEGRVFLLPASATLVRETDVLTQGVIGRLLVNTIIRSDLRAGLVLLDVVGLPGRVAALPLDSLVDPATLDHKGFAAVQNVAPLPDGPTRFSTAIVTELASPAIDARAMLKDVRANMPTSRQQAVFVHEPADTAWLTGEPPPSVPVAAAEPPRTAAETVSGSPALAADATAPVNASEPLVLDDVDCRRAQLALRRMGYYDGKPDGVAGPDTRAAIRRFQHELNAEITGRLTRGQTDRLFAASR